MRVNKVNSAGEEKNGDLLLEAADDLSRCEENLLTLIFSYWFGQNYQVEGNPSYYDSIWFCELAIP